MIKIRILVENKTYKTQYIGEHGLSVYIETEDKKILYDTGMSDAFVQNARQMGVDLADVDFAVISHGHHDHAGGVPDFLKANAKSPVYIHKDAFNEPYPMEDGKLSETHCGIRWTGMLDKIRERLILTDGVTNIGEDIVVSGTIPKIDGFEPTAQFYTKNEKNEYVIDDMRHEQFLAIRNKKAGGVFVFSGCSHTGVVPCIKYAQSLFPGEAIVALISGMHLYGADNTTIRQTLDEILKLEVKMHVPLHCTGIEAMCELKKRISDRCVILNTGGLYQWG
ncbi:MAG: MBL fold metallo-hydrolase [Christensenellales bacterium]